MPWDLPHLSLWFNHAQQHASEEDMAPAAKKERSFSKHDAGKFAAMTIMALGLGALMTREVALCVVGLSLVASGGLALRFCEKYNWPRLGHTRQTPQGPDDDPEFIGSLRKDKT